LAEQSTPVTAGFSDTYAAVAAWLVFGGGDVEVWGWDEIPMKPVEIKLDRVGETSQNIINTSGHKLF
jgi:hypothetical protein